MLPASTSSPNVNPWEVLEVTNDHRLKLTIEEVEPMCHKFGTLIQIRYVFQNLTDSAFLLQSRFFISPTTGRNGDLILRISTSEGQSLENFALIETVADWQRPDDFKEVVAMGTFETILDFDFSTHLLSTDSPSGEYLVKFLYANYESGTSDTWMGTLSSNQIEICIES